MVNNVDKPRRGQGMVEFALVFPLLLILVLGIIEIGRLIFTYSATIAASREGARYGAAIQDIGGGVPQYQDCEGIRAAAKRIGGMAGINDSNITIQYSDEAGIYDTNCPPTHTVKRADQIIVTADTVYTPFVSLVNIPPIPMNSSSSRTIIKEVEIGKSSTGGFGTGGDAEVNFRSTFHQAYETEGTISIQVILSQSVGSPVSVPFSLTGTAEKGTDYTITSSPIIIPAGSLTATIDVTLINDGVTEGNESLVIGLETPTNANKGPQNIHTVTIMDPPTVSFRTISSSVSEEANDTVITVELSNTSYQDITVPFTTSGTATWGSLDDYTTTSSPLTFPPGTKSRSLIVYPNNDALDEDEETVVLTLQTPANALLGPNDTHTLTITDNDAPPYVSFQVPTVEVSEGVGTLTTSVVLSAVSGKDISIPFTLNDITTTPGDYTLITPSPLTINAGSKKADILIGITENDGYNNDNDALIEDFELVLGNPTNAELGSPSIQTITITENVVQPEVSFVNGSQVVDEGDGSLTILVQMSNAYTSDVSVPFSLSGSAEPGSSNDYTISNSPVVIPAGRTVGEIEVQLKDDHIDETAENIIITMGEVTNGTAVTPSTHAITIADDDDPPAVSFHRIAQSVGELDGTAPVRVVLSAPSSFEITVPFTLGGTATQDEDYTVTTQEITLPPYSYGGYYNINIIDDSHYDDGETISLTIETPTNASKGSITEHTVTIDDDELPPCDLGTYLLTAGTESLTWSLVNDGQSVTFTGGTITWPEESTNKPRLSTITFGGVEVYSGNEIPGTMSFSALEDFPTLTTRDLHFQFKSILGKGEHTITAYFENTEANVTCSQTITYNQP